MRSNNKIDKNSRRIEQVQMSLNKYYTVLVKEKGIEIISCHISPILLWISSSSIQDAVVHYSCTFSVLICIRCLSSLQI